MVGDKSPMNNGILTIIVSISRSKQTTTTQPKNYLPRNKNMASGYPIHVYSN